MSYTVALTTDKLTLHAFLQRDPIWAAYAIGDLEPARFSWCTWHVAEDAAGRPAGLVLMYRRLDPPILLTMGETAAVAAILEQMALPQQVYVSAREEHRSGGVGIVPPGPQVYVSAREEHLPLLLAHYDFSTDRVRPMLRMAVTAESFIPAPALPDARPVLRRLDSADVPAIEALIALGGPFAPDAFTPSQVAEGVFFGIELTGAGLAVLGRTASPGSDAPSLLAVAGTHLVAPAWGVAAVGNVYVHPARRGRCYGSLVSSAVTAALLQRGLLVVLNVDQDNPAAINLYRQLGFAVHCPFVEGIGQARNA